VKGSYNFAIDKLIKMDDLVCFRPFNFMLVLGHLWDLVFFRPFNFMLVLGHLWDLVFFRPFNFMLVSSLWSGSYKETLEETKRVIRRNHGNALKWTITIKIMIGIILRRKLRLSKPNPYTPVISWKVCPTEIERTGWDLICLEPMKTYLTEI
jgi:hypothetical protein